MDQWINGVWDSVTGSVQSVVDAGRQLLLTIWHRLIDVFVPVAAGWSLLTSGFHWATGQLEALGISTYQALHHVVTYWVPHWAEWALGKASDLVSAAVGQLAAWTRGALVAVYDWAASQLAALRSWALGLLDYLTSRIGAVWDWIDAVARPAINLLLHPAALAALLFGPLWEYLVGYVQAHARAIGAWIIRASLAATVGAAHLIESFLTDLFM